MSGSYDRLGSRMLPSAHQGAGYPPSDGFGDPYPAPPDGAVPPLRSIHAPAQSSRADPDPAKAAIVPAGSVTGRSLTLVISIMCFFACLTAGAAYMMHQSASAWLKDIASEVTIQVEPRENVETETNASGRRVPPTAADR